MTGRLLKGALWVSLTRVLVNLASFVSTLVLARFLTPGDFGLVAIATTISTVIITITDLSLNSALIHHEDPDDSHYNSAWTLNVIRAAILTAVVWAIAYPIALFYKDPRLTGIMLALGLTTLISGANNPKNVVFARALVFRQQFTVTTIQKISNVAVACAVAIFYKSYWAIIIGMLAGQFAGLVTSYVLMPYVPKPSLKHAKSLISFSVWLSLGQAIKTLNWRFDYLFIGWGLGKTPLGYYTVGDTLSVLPTRESTTPIATTLFPAFARLRDDPARLRAAYQRAQTLLFALALPCGVGFALVAEPLIMLVMGEKWAPAIPIVQALASIFAVQTLATTVQPLAMALGENRAIFQRDLVGFLTRVPLIVAGLYLGGLMGVVYMRCASGLLGTLLNIMLVRRLLGLSVAEQLAVNIRTAISVGVMAAVVLLVVEPNIPLTGSSHMDNIIAVVAIAAAGALVYAASRLASWWAVGKPEGPETEVFRIAGKALQRVRQFAS